jgi:hypothetical protein
LLPDDLDRLPMTLPIRQVKMLNRDFRMWGRDGKQLPPDEPDWRSWLILGGRGAGKTRAGAEWVKAQALGDWTADGAHAERIAIIGPTLGPGLAADTYLAGSAIAVPAGGLRAGTRYLLTFDVTKTAAGVAPPVLTLRFGTAGAVSDAALAALSFPAQTAAADDGRFALDVTFRSVGAGSAAVVQAVASLTHTLAAGGFATSPGPVRRATSPGFNSMLAGAVIGLSVNGGAAAAWTVSLVQARLENLA